MPINKFFVLKDTREKQGWDFVPSVLCAGTKITTLHTGDYTLEGFEKEIIIERKASTGEFALNVFQPRFEKELIRLDEFAHPFLICEFTLEDIMQFPTNSGIPPNVWPKLKATPFFLLKYLNQIQLNHKIKVIFAGKEGKLVVSDLFKRIIERSHE